MSDSATATSPERITTWLGEWRQGSEQAREQLFAVVHPTLRQIAARHLRQERLDHTLEPNALVNELYLRLLGATPLPYQDRAHFFAIAAQTMRRILIDHARARIASKRGGARVRVPLTAVDGVIPGATAEELIGLDEALSRLAAADARAAQVVELRFFGGLLEQEIADVLGTSLPTVKRDWKRARAWLLTQL